MNKKRDNTKREIPQENQKPDISCRPGVDCECQVCVFSKSQAPGQPYDITKCPLWNKGQSKKPKTEEKSSL